MATIEALKQQFDGEWLAISDLKESPSGLEEGELLFHCRDRDEIWARIKGDRRTIYVTYAGPPWPEGVDGVLL